MGGAGWRIDGWVRLGGGEMPVCELPFAVFLLELAVCHYQLHCSCLELIIPRLSIPLSSRLSPLEKQ